MIIKSVKLHSALIDDSKSSEGQKLTLLRQDNDSQIYNSGTI